MEEELERQQKLAEELENEVDTIIQKLYDLREIIDNEELMYGLTPELKHIQKVIERTIENSMP